MELIQMQSQMSICLITGALSGSDCGWSSASWCSFRCWPLIYVARKPDVYQAGARVQVDLENNAALVGKTPYVFGPTNDPVYFNTQLQILVSPGLMRRVVKTLDLEHNPDFFKGNSTQKRSTWQTIKNMAGLGGANKVDPNAKPNDQLQLRTTVAAASSRDDLAEAKRLAPYVSAILVGLESRSG